MIASGMQCKMFIASALMVGAVQLSRAETKQEPLWKLGLGLGGVTFQDYPGSRTSHVYPLPIAYVDFATTLLPP